MNWEQYLIYCGAVQIAAFLFLVYGVIFSKWGFKGVKPVDLFYMVLAILTFPCWFYLLVILAMIFVPVALIFLLSFALKKIQEGVNSNG